MIKEGLKNKVGRPERYPGEEQRRLSVMIRPRYKELLELLATLRQTSVSEATEFAVANMARSYEVEGKPLLDYVRPSNESHDRYRATLSDLPHPQVDTRVQEEITSLTAFPSGLRGHFENWAVEFFDGCLTLKGHQGWGRLDWDRLIYAMREDYRESKTPLEAARTFLDATTDYFS